MTLQKIHSVVFSMYECISYYKIEMCTKILYDLEKEKQKLKNDFVKQKKHEQERKKRKNDDPKNSY